MNLLQAANHASIGCDDNETGWPSFQEYGKGTGMAVKTSVADIDAQIEKLRDKRKAIVAKASERFARAAAKAGLTELDIDDDALDAAFVEIAARFRKDATDRKATGNAP